jgi:hypothetical protein
MESIDAPGLCQVNEQTLGSYTLSRIPFYPKAGPTDEEFATVDIREGVRE